MLRTLWVVDSTLEEIGPLAGLSNLAHLDLSSNRISDISALVENAGLGHGDIVKLQDNPLSEDALNRDIPLLKERGVKVVFEPVQKQTR